MMRKKNTGDDQPGFVRVFDSAPREKFVGKWVKGRLYPLYNVVENNGSLFMSLTGKMKEEPYVMYNKTTNTFSANDGWVIKAMSADSRISAVGGNGSGVTPEEMQAALAGKQDVISDLSAIRSGASSGATAYQKPNSGIPKNDLSSGVKASLDKADSALQPGDIPEISTDISTDATSDTKTASPKAVKTYVDNNSSPDAVKYVSQSLTSEQQAQARTNIGATAPEVFWAIYGTTTYADVMGAHNSGKLCACKYDGHVYYLSAIITNSYPLDDLVSFDELPSSQNDDATTLTIFVKSNNEWDYETGYYVVGEDSVIDWNNKYTKPLSGIPASDLASGVIPTISTDISTDAASDAKTASPKAVKTYVDGVAENIGDDIEDLETAMETIGNGAYVVAWDGTSTPVAANIPSGVSVTYNTTTYNGSLSASASTLGKIYLVSTGTSGNYDRYVTVGSSTYSWVGIGTTAIALADYATEAELSQLVGIPRDVEVSQDSYVNAGSFSYWSGTWHSGNSYSGKFIPVLGAEKIKVQSAQGKKTHGVFCTYIFQENGSSLSISYYDNGSKDVDVGGSAEYDVPADAAYFWCLINAQENCAAPTVTLLGAPASSGIVPTVEGISNDLNGISADIRIPPTSYIVAGNFGFWGGTWHSSAAHKGAFVPVEGKKSIKVTTTNSKFYGVFCTGTTQTNNSNVSVSTVDGTAKSLNAGYTEVYSVPSDAKYLWYNVNVSDGKDTPLVFEPSESLGLKDRVGFQETRVAELEEAVADLQDYVTFGTDDDWLLSNNVQVFHNVNTNKTAFHNSSGHWLVDGIKCCKNPVVYYNCPDMSIICIDNIIYGYSSHSHGQIFRTYNFAKWEKLNERVLPLATYTNYWAPDANIINGKIVIYFSCDNNTLVIATSDTPAPESGFTVEATYSYGAIDYCYADGVLFYGSGTIYYRVMTDYKTPSNTAVATNMSGEGVMIWHHGDYYYAFVSFPSSQDYHYNIMVYRSTTLESTTWEFGSIILTTPSEAMLCGPGHMSEVFEDSDGNYFALMQVHIYDSGWSFRPTSIQQLIVNSNGWPQFVDYQGNVTTAPQLLCKAPVMPITIEK